jgi:hypothetical protein
MLDDAMTPANPPEPKKSKTDFKKEEIFKERMRRHINSGKTPEQAYMAIQKEDYDRMPVGDKLELMRRSFASSLESMAKDVAMLHDNQKSLADVMDINFRAFDKMMVKLGISSEDQATLITEVQAEIVAEREALQAQRAAAVEEAKKAELVKKVDVAGEVKVPEGAQVFGG